MAGSPSGGPLQNIGAALSSASGRRKLSVLNHQRVFIGGNGRRKCSWFLGTPVAILLGGAPHGERKVQRLPVPSPVEGDRNFGIFQYNFFLKLSRVQRKCFQDLRGLEPPRQHRNFRITSRKKERKKKDVANVGSSPQRCVGCLFPLIRHVPFCT